MDEKQLRALLRRVKSGALGLDQAVDRLRDLPFADLGYATVDTHRSLRTGFPEVVLGHWKTVPQLIGIVETHRKRGHTALVTRLQTEKAQALTAHFGRVKSVWHLHAQAWVLPGKFRLKPRGTVAVVCAGTSDLPVAEEAAVTAETFGAKVVRVTDVGVAGIHRLLKKRTVLAKADVVIAIAGMEGALASAVGGLVSAPVVAVPTSVGYGASFRGVAPLLGMLTSCASNVAVVNIDNGFGAGYYAALIARRTQR